MKIKVNGEDRLTEASTLEALLIELGLAEAAVATARNGVFVSRQARPETNLTEGDAIEVLSPRQGG